MQSARRSSVLYIGWLFELPFFLYQLEAVWLVSSDLWHQLIRELLLAEYFLLSDHSRSTLAMIALENPTISAVSEIVRPNCCFTDTKNLNTIFLYPYKMTSPSIRHEW